MLALLIGGAVAIGVLTWLVWGMGYGRDHDDEHSDYTEPHDDIGPESR